MKFRVLLLSIVIVFSALYGWAEDGVQRICQELAKSPGDESLLEMLKSQVVSDHPDAKSGRLAVIYGLGLLYTGKGDMAEKVKGHVASTHSESPFLRYLTDAYTAHRCAKCAGKGKASVACEGCGGSGVCPTCEGRGRIVIRGMGPSGLGTGNTATRRMGGAIGPSGQTTICGKCMGSGHCQTCKGGKVQEVTCTACRGRGNAPHAAKINSVYLALLKGERVPSLEELNRAVAESSEPSPESEGPAVDKSALTSELASYRAEVEKLEELFKSGSATRVNFGGAISKPEAYKGRLLTSRVYFHQAAFRRVDVTASSDGGEEKIVSLVPHVHEVGRNAVSLIKELGPGKPVLITYGIVNENNRLLFSIEPPPVNP